MGEMPPTGWLYHPTAAAGIPRLHLVSAAAAPILVVDGRTSPWRWRSRRAWRWWSPLCVVLAAVPMIGIDVLGVGGHTYA